MPKKRSSPAASMPEKLLLKLANDDHNPLKKLSNYDSQTESIALDVNDLKLVVKCYTWQDLSPELQQWMINTTEKHMKKYYEKSAWGWDRQAKLNELNNKNSRHLLISESHLLYKPIAFIHFRFEKGYAMDATLYCYEFQVEEEYRRRGIGRELIELLLTLATDHRMKKVLLTVLKNNVDAFKFYMDQGFKIDKSSPSSFGQQVDYEILSRPTIPKSKKTQSQVANSNGSSTKPTNGAA